MNKLTTIYLTEKEAKLFLDFREHQSEVIVLRANGIFSMKNGSITCHFDEN